MLSVIHSIIPLSHSLFQFDHKQLTIHIRSMSNEGVLCMQMFIREESACNGQERKKRRGSARPNF